MDTRERDETPGQAPLRTDEVGMAKTRAGRWALLGFGWLCGGLGAIGVLLPGLPTTPFMLLALWAFARSSQRFHDWLYNHTFFGPPLKRWHRHRVIPLRAKIFALATMAGSLALSWFVFAVPPIGMIGIGVFMGIGAAYILSCPSRLPDGAG